MPRGATRSRIRKARPGLESLEGRQLLDGGGLSVGFGPGATDAGMTLSPVELRSTGLEPGSSEISVDQSASDGPSLADVGVTMLQAPPIEAQQTAAQNGLPDPPVKTFRYTTPRGGRVAINLSGPGTLAGTSVRPDGALDLVFDGTGPNSQIFAHATGVVPLASVRDADVPLEAQAGAGANQLGLAGLRPFNLIEGGTINLIGGVRRLGINNVGPNTQVFLRELPEVALERAAQAGRDTTFATDQAGGVELVLTDGNFFPVLTPTPVEQTGPPPGIRIQIAGRINGEPLAPLPPGTNPQDELTIGNPQVYGYDATAGQLIRFDATTGAVVQTIAVPSLAPSAGVSTAKVDDRLLVLVGQANTVRAFEALDRTLPDGSIVPAGTFVGQFTTDNLPTINAIDGIGTTDLRTVLVDSTASGGVGSAQVIDLAASLDPALNPGGITLLPGWNTVPAPNPALTFFTPTRQFGFLGGATGVPGFDPLAVLGRGFFDEFQPTTEILGVMALNPIGARLQEIDRTGAPGLPPAPPAGTDEALGSVDSAVARVVGVVDGKNVVNLVSRTTLNRIGTTELDYPTLLSGLSESFRPKLAGTAVFDIQGDVQAFLAQDAQGLVLNTLGTLHLVGINRARDSFIVGFPLNHVYLGPGSRNVSLVTPAPRPPGTRPDVTVIPGLQPIGPLFIP
ncbi:hypothetical protein [Tautonia rosea]|uniref:hypothetical protein n=1 Tax=Tautonia rosea TaxID=2728037 RepID=UPI001474BB3B|nr:hypothetical protein [Tautonia rosea]